MSNEKIKMTQTMRWFGPNDPVPLEYIKMAGATGIVSSLHQIPNGILWTVEEIQERKRLIEEAGLVWSVCESIPVHEDIKLRSGNYKEYIRNYIATIQNLCACGIHTICYNYMPLLDWTRTNLKYPCPDGSLALRFSWRDIAVFDIYLFKRKGAENDYADMFPEGLDDYYKSLSTQDLRELEENILKGLPGSEQSYTLDDFRALYNRISILDRETLQSNLLEFLKEIVPYAEEAKAKLAIHPDDPPVPIFGVPRVVSSEEDLNVILGTVDSPSNGFTFCSGSYGVNPSNDLPGMIRRLGEKLNFIHLRNVRRDKEGNFFESDHLDGDVDMREVITAILSVMKRRKTSLPMRPDHGHRMMFELNSEKVNPGYTILGRLRGLAELRGLELGLSENV